MKVHTVGIIMNGVTGRMGTNQHLLRSIAKIISQGGVKISSDEVIMPDPAYRTAAGMPRRKHRKAVE